MPPTVDRCAWKTTTGFTHRSLAAAYLGDVGPKFKSVIPALLEVLDDDDTVLRFAAVHALGKFGSDAKNALRRASSDKDPYVRSAATEALKKIKAQELYPER